jgi:hypothetical protein
MQAARNIFLIRPANFRFNPETAVTNEFQKTTDEDDNLLEQNALAEFDQFVKALCSNGITIRVVEDTEFPQKPDAVFPNNWVSFHPDGTVVLYPMCAENRRSERRLDIIEALRSEFRIEKIIDLSHFENEGRFLEGTGSIVFDHANKTAYACISPRTDPGLFKDLSQGLGYRPISFHAADANGRAIYHTNVMMTIGPGFAVICLESIRDQSEQTWVIETLRAGGLDVIEISLAQMNCFAGNMLAVSGCGQTTFLVLSTNALDSFTKEQRTAMERHCELLPVAIPTIESVGGGGVRCMMAEVFLPSAS